MSTLRVDNITSRVGGTAPTFPNGVQVTGVVTATKFVGDASGLTNIPAAGNTAAFATIAGVATALNANSSVNTTGIITASTLNGTHTGTWNGVAIAATVGGTGQTTYTTGDILYASASNTLTKLSVGSNGQVLTVSSGVPTWAASAGGGGGGGGSSGSGAGLGLFNTGISTSVGYTITNSLTAGLSLPSTAGYRYIIHSIQISNIDANNATVDLTSDITGTNYSNNINIASTIPIPGGTGLELLQRPKVLYPSNTIRFQGSTNGTLTAMITYEESTDTNYFGEGITLTSTSATDAFQPTTANAVVESILVTNVHGTSDAKVTLEWTNGSNTRQTYICNNVIIPADSTVEIIEGPKIIPKDHKIRATANVANRLEVIVAGKLK